jgi:hypothetical protein
MASYDDEPGLELDELDEPTIDEDAAEDWREADLLRTSLDEDEEISGDY